MAAGTIEIRRVFEATHRLGFKDGWGCGTYLCIIDENNEPVQGGSLLRFNQHGRIVRCQNVHPKFGFELDHNGSVKFSRRGA
jgi:hypothetical protein